MVLLQTVRSYFADIGVDMEIRKMAPAEYTDYVENKHNHDQLIYRPYGPLGQTYAPLGPLLVFILDLTG